MKKFLVSCLSISLISSTVMMHPIDAKTETPRLQIHDIQGNTYQSKYANQHVDAVQGIVTYQYKINGQHYFHLQTPDRNADNDPKTLKGLSSILVKKPLKLKLAMRLKFQV